jgi:hypothetical protein
LHRVAELAEPLRYERAGATLLEAELGVLMKISAGRDEGAAVHGW